MRVRRICKEMSTTLRESDRLRLEARVADRHTRLKQGWSARIVPPSADRVGANAFMAGAGTAKTSLWRWRARFTAEGVEGLLRAD